MSDSNVLEDARPSASPARGEERRAFIKSFGCQMNVYDAERMADIAAEEGYREAQRAEDADLVVLNTCAIRDHAEQKAISELGRLKRMKSKGSDFKVVVMGCMVGPEEAQV